MKSAARARLRAARPVETLFSDRNTSYPIMAKTPLAILASPCLFLSQPCYSTLEFVDVGIMRPQPVNNETKDVAHQLRSTYCLTSISSAPRLHSTNPASLCVFILRLCARCGVPFLCCRVFVVCSACLRLAPTKKHI